MDDHQIREAALRLSIEAFGRLSITGSISGVDDKALLERARKFENYLRGPSVVDGPDGDEPLPKPKTWRDHLGLT